MNDPCGDFTQHQLPPRQAFVQVILVTCVFLFNFLSRLILAPFLVHIEQGFNVSHTQAGGLFLFLSLGFSISLPASGFVAKWLQHRKTIILSGIGTGLTLLAASRAESLIWLKSCLFLMGTCVGLYLPSGISTITSVLTPNHWGKGLAIHEIAPNLSFILCPAIAAAVEGWLSWRTVFALLGIGALFMGLLFARLGQGGRFPGEAPNPAVLRQVLIKPQFWILLVLFSLAIGATFGTYSMLPLYLVSEHGLSREWANELVALSRVPCLGLVLLAGLFIDRLGARASIVFALCLTGALTVLLGVLQGIPLQATVLVQAVFAVFYFPAGFTVISSCFPTRLRNVAISFIIPSAAVFGTGIVPTLLGWFGDQKAFAAGFVIIGVLTLLGTGLVAFLQLERGSPEEGFC
jgi:NNP family nitrate/nitrite transporter-like MFS transporter